MFRTKLFTHLSRGVSGSAAINLRNVVEKNNTPLRSAIGFGVCSAGIALLYFSDESIYAKNDNYNKRKTTNVVKLVNVKNDWPTTKKLLVDATNLTTGERMEAEQRGQKYAHKKAIFILEELKIELPEYEREYQRRVPSYASSR